MADPHLDHPGEVSWFPGKGPAQVLGPCPHTRCPHNAGAAIAWGPDLEHYTLDECRVGPEVGGCDGQCRSWAAEVPIEEGPGKGRIRYSWGPWLHVELDPTTVAQPAPDEPEELLLPGIDLPVLHTTVQAAPIGQALLEELAQRRERYLASLAKQGIELSPEDRQAMTLGYDVAVGEVLLAITEHGWLIIERPEIPTSEPAGG